MDPISDIGGIVLGFIRRGEIQAWCRLGASCLATTVITGLGVFGISLAGELAGGVPIPMALALSLASSCTLTSVCLYALWMKSPLTKNMPLLIPMKIEAARIEELTKEGTVYVVNDKKGGS
jgi:hypothetical protein